MSEIENIYKLFLSHPHVSTDTRSIKKDSLFFALKGDNFDANAFAEEALKKGASFAIVDDKSLTENPRFIQVENCLEALQQLAKHHREQFDIPVLGITGTNGKTTTKELMYEVLSKKYNVLATVGNFNNHIGVPLTLLRITNEHEIAIIEMGANHIGEIEFLCGLSNPNYGIITNIGRAHLGGFGSYEGVKQTKTELYRHIESRSGKLFVNGGDDFLMSESRTIERICYGENSDCKSSYSITDDGIIELSLVNSNETQIIKTNLFGSYNYLNLLCAICIGKYFNVTNDDISNALSNYEPTNNRSQIVKKGSNTVILDAYNANPTSVDLALNSFYEMKGEIKVAIIGDMLELGDDEEREHIKVIEKLTELNLGKVYLVGKIFSRLNDTDLQTYPNVDSLISELKSIQGIENSLILIKGSRGIKLEKVLEVFS